MDQAVNDAAAVSLYDGPLLRGALRTVERSRRREITPDEYQDEIGELFDRHPPGVALAEWVERSLADGQDHMLYWRTAPNAIRFQILHMRPNKVHPPHGHANLISNQVVLYGRVHLREYDRIARVDEDTVLLKLATDRWLGVGERIRTTATEREVHWFGAGETAAVQLNFSVSGLQEWTFDAHRGRTRGRVYFDPTGPVQSDGLIFGKEISLERSEAMFQGRPLSHFPPRRPNVVAAAE
jgi:hypothetical protein